MQELAAASGMTPAFSKQLELLFFRKCRRNYGAVCCVCYNAMARNGLFPSLGLYVWIPQRTAITPPALEDEDLRKNIYVSCRKLLRYRFFRDDFDERKTIAMRCVALRNPSVVMETRHNAMNRPIYSPFVVSATDRCNLLQGRLDHVFTQSVQQVAITVVQCIYYATTTG